MELFCATPACDLRGACRSQSRASLIFRRDVRERSCAAARRVARSRRSAHAPPARRSTSPPSHCIRGSPPRCASPRAHWTPAGRSAEDTRVAARGRARFAVLENAVIANYSVPRFRRVAPVTRW